ncbi:MAG: site-specific integrase, partial [Candidatus Promineifilaceae bacterium]
MPARDLARKTREEYECDVRGLVEYLEGRELVYWDEVELKHLQGYLARLEKQQLKTSTRNRKSYSFKTFFKYLVEHGHLVSNPAENLIPP